MQFVVTVAALILRRVVAERVRPWRIASSLRHCSQSSGTIFATLVRPYVPLSLCSYARQADPDSSLTVAALILRRSVPVSQRPSLMLPQRGSTAPNPRLLFP